MSGKIIKDFFDRFKELLLKVRDGLYNAGEIIQCRSEEVLKESGSVAHYLYFILKGSGGILLYNRKNFICTDILYQGEFLGEFLSFLTQTPTSHELRSFENSTMLRFSRLQL